MRRPINILLLLLSLLLMSHTAMCAEEAYESLYEYEEETEFLENYIDWDNFHIKIDSEEYNFPMKESELPNRGWHFEILDLSDYEIKPLEIYRFTMVKEGKGRLKADFYVVNKSLENKPVHECDLCGIYINEESFLSGEHEIVILDDIMYGKSTIDEINDEYGYEDHIEDSNIEGYYTYCFTDSENKKLLIDIDDNSGILKEFLYLDKNAGNEIEEQIDWGYDEDASNYIKPGILGDEYNDYRVGIGEEVYTLPVPVQVLYSDGWEMVGVEDNEILLPSQEHRVEFFKEGKSFTAFVKNIFDSPDFEKYGWVISIKVSEENSSDVFDFASLPCGIKTGISEEELVSKLESVGLPFKDFDSGEVRSYYTVDTELLRKYVFLCQATQNAYEASVYVGDDGKHKQNTVIDISVFNDPELYDEGDSEPVDSIASNNIDWDNFYVKVDSAKYIFPMYSDVLFGAGWSLLSSDSDTVLVPPLEYQFEDCTNDKEESLNAAFCFSNQSEEELPLKSCIISGIGIDTSDYDSNLHKMILPSDIKVGESNLSSIQQAYGKEDYSFDYDDGISYYYYTDGYGKILCLGIDKQTGVLSLFSYKDEYAVGDVLNSLDNELDESQLSYESPSELGTAYNDYRIEIEDDVYTLPVPVNTLMNDGWLPSDIYDGEMLLPGQVHVVEFTKDDVSFIGVVKNIDEKLRPELNTWVVSVEVPTESSSEQEELGEYYYAVASLPGGIIPGITEDELKEILFDSGLTYAQKESNLVFSYFKEPEKEMNIVKYMFLAQSADNTYIAAVYTGDDGKYPKNTVCSILVSNDPEFYS